MRSSRLMVVSAALLLFVLPTTVSAQDDKSDTYRQLKLFGDVF